LISVEYEYHERRKNIDEAIGALFWNIKSQLGTNRSERRNYEKGFLAARHSRRRLVCG